MISINSDRMPPAHEGFHETATVNPLRAGMWMCRQLALEGD